MNKVRKTYQPIICNSERVKCVVFSTRHRGIVPRATELHSFLFFETIFHHFWDYKIFMVYSYIKNKFPNKISWLMLSSFLSHYHLKILNECNTKNNRWKKLKKILFIHFIIPMKWQQIFRFSSSNVRREKRIHLKNSF